MRTTIKINSKLPAIWWHKQTKQYAAKIGYREVETAAGPVRKRAFQLLGKDHVQAMRKALDLTLDWQWTVQYYKESFPDKSPCWFNEQQMRVYQAAERGGIDALHDTGVVVT